MIAWTVVFAGSLFAGVDPAQAADVAHGNLWIPSESAGYQRMDPMEYEPREGDLLFFTDEKWVRRVLFWCAGTGRPYHVGLVVKDAQGQFCTLEARPHSENWVFILKMRERMETYHGSIWVRRLRKPLSEEQSKTLTNFAYSQQGKPFAFMRLAFEGTPLSVRRGLGRLVFAGPHTQKPNWFCSELTTAALIECGLFEGRGVWPNCVYPRDLFYDRTYRVNDLFEAPLLWSQSLENGPPPPRLVGLPRPEPLETLSPARRVRTEYARQETPAPAPASPYTIKEISTNPRELSREIPHGPKPAEIPSNKAGLDFPNGSARSDSRDSSQRGSGGAPVPSRVGSLRPLLP
jgi:hypothetical protein